VGPALIGAVAGGAVGALVLAGFVALGLLLSSRVTNPLPVIVLGVAGAYAGWLLGVIVFGAVRGPGSEDAEQPNEP
jgi:hypothetical protein